MQDRTRIRCYLCLGSSRAVLVPLSVSWAWCEAFRTPRTVFGDGGRRLLVRSPLLRP